MHRKDKCYSGFIALMCVFFAFDRLVLFSSLARLFLQWSSGAQRVNETTTAGWGDFTLSSKKKHQINQLGSAGHFWRSLRVDKLCVGFFCAWKTWGFFQHFFSWEASKKSCELIQFMLRMSCVCIFLKPTYSHFVCLGRSWFDGFRWAERCWKTTYAILHIIFVYIYIQMNIR